MKEWNKRSEESVENIILCMSCGFPNRADDKSCMYCGIPISGACRSGFKQKISIYMEQRKWKKRVEERRKFLNKADNSIKEKGTFLSKFFLSVMGFGMLLGGVALFVSAGAAQNFKIWLLSVLLILYGVYTASYILKK